jgi:nucleotide-binding universal stress UspA family protein
VGYDGSPESKLALQAAKNLAASTGAEIIALQLVMLPAYAYGPIGAVVLANLDVAVEEAEKEMQALEGVEGRAQYGLGSDLGYFAEEVDLLVVGSRGYGPWGRMIHGSTSSKLARHTRAPLLIVPRAVAAGADAESAGSAKAAVAV